MNVDAFRRWWPVAAAALLLTVAAVAAAHSTPQLTPLRGAEPTAQAEQPELAQREADEPQPPPEPVAPNAVSGWVLGPVLTAFLALVAAVILAGLVIAVRDQFRRRPARRPRETLTTTRATVPSAEVVAALDAGLVELDDADADPRRAVIACWVRLEQAAAAAGTPRQPADTSTDLVARVLAGHAVSGPVLEGFAAVYREARYATHDVGDDMRAQARAALRRLRAELTGADPASAGQPAAVRTPTRPAAGGDPAWPAAGGDVIT